MMERVRFLKLSRRLTVALISVGAFMAYAQTDSLRSSAPVSDSVLIAKSDTYLENAVAAILTDSLNRRGLKVRTIDIRKVNRPGTDDYRTIIVFNGVKSNDLVAPVRSLMTSSAARRAKVLISMVYGERWDGSQGAVDAFTAATKTLQPNVIARRILRSLAPGDAESKSQ
jgi:hypothetical protein